MKTIKIKGVVCRPLKNGEVVKQGDIFDNGAPAAGSIGKTHMILIRELWLYRPINRPPSKPRKARKLRSGDAFDISPTVSLVFWGESVTIREGLLEPLELTGKEVIKLHEVLGKIIANKRRTS